MFCHIFYLVANDTSNESKQTSFQFDDPATWPFPLPQNLRSEIIDNGPAQNILDKYPKKDNRCFTKENFVRVTSNDRQHRDWLLYSQSTNSLFCFPCCLFPPQNVTSWSNFGPNGKGFCCFTNQSKLIMQHEQSYTHFSSVIH